MNGNPKVEGEFADKSSNGCAAGGGTQKVADPPPGRTFWCLAVCCLGVDAAQAGQWCQLAREDALDAITHGLFQDADVADQCLEALGLQ